MNWIFNSDLFREYRKDYGFSQNDIANYCGCSRNTISSIENGIFQPSLDLYIKLCLSVKVDNLTAFISYLGGFEKEDIKNE